MSEPYAEPKGNLAFMRKRIVGNFPVPPERPDLYTTPIPEGVGKPELYPPDDDESLRRTSRQYLKQSKQQPYAR